MATAPLKPTKTPVPVAAPVATPTVVPEKKKEVPKPPEKKIQKQYTQGATLFKSDLSPARDRYRETVKITFLTGIYQGRSLHLGTNTMKFDDTQTAVWNEEPGKGVKVGSNFSHISPTEMNFSVSFVSDHDDVAQLSENCREMHHITLLGETDPRNPPILRIVTGKRVYEESKCMSVKCSYEHPHADGIGWGVVKVEMSFQDTGGRDSVNRDAPPACATPLDAEISKLTTAELQRQADTTKAKAFAECLKSGSTAIEDIIKNNQQQDVAVLKALPPELLLNFAIGGGIVPPALDDPGLQDKLKYAIAYELVRKEPGVTPANTPIATTANAIVAGSSSGVREPIISVFDQLSAAYTSIFEAITTRNFLKVYEGEGSATTSTRFNKIGLCGNNIRNQGGFPSQGNNVSEDVAIADSISSFLSDGDMTDAHIKKYFGLPDDTPETVIRKIKEGRPYTNKAQFMDKATYGQGAVTGYSAWAGFVASETANLSAINAFITRSGVTDSEIGTAFGVSGDAIAKVKNNNRNFASKKAFLKAISGSESTSEGNKTWNTFWRYQQSNPPATP